MITTPLEAAANLRATADWIERGGDPDLALSRGQLFTWHARDGIITGACALGRAAIGHCDHSRDLNLVVETMEGLHGLRDTLHAVALNHSPTVEALNDVANDFDNDNDERACAGLRRAAAILEATIPHTPEPTPQEAAACPS